MQHVFHLVLNDQELWEEVTSGVDVGERLLWTHIQVDEYEEAQEILENMSVSEALIGPLLESDSRPRILNYEGQLLSCFRCINTNDSSDPDDMIAIKFLLSKNRLLSLSKRSVKGVAETKADLLKQVGDVKNSVDVWMYALQVIHRRIGSLIEIIDDHIMEMEESLDKNIDDIQSQRHVIIRMRRFLLPQRELFEEWADKYSLSLNKKQKMTVGEFLNRTQRFLDVLDTGRQRLNLLQDEYRVALSDQMNRNMLNMSRIGFLLLPLTLISGMLGMNVGGIPWSQDPWGFWKVCMLFGAVFFMFSVWIVVVERWLRRKD